MHQGKLSELIHNSVRYPDLEQCSAEVHFREIIDLLDVTRTKAIPAPINGRSRSYKKVRGLLKGRGIDPDHKRLLILQGKVESIVQMKPKGGEHNEGLFEYLEDIIGTSKYKEPIETAFVDLENPQERPEVVQSPAEHEKQDNELSEKRKHAAGKAKKLKKECERCSLKSAHHMIEDSEEKLEKEKKIFHTYEESLVREEKVLEEIQDSLRDKTQKFYD
ncbi:hypothetical protein F5880DRAFT_1688311 [Lentinula raphanica]|nr:hypothetical protein F5880DRAFT_1688311 [Lentinula raphanica]